MSVLDYRTQRVAPYWIAGVVLVMAAFATGCSGGGSENVATTADSPAATKPRLEERVQIFWDARKDNDFITTYQMEAQALPGGALTPDKYFKAVSNRLPMAGYTVSDSSISDGSAVVILETVHILRLMGTGHPVKNEVKDHWIWVNNDWYRDGGRRKPSK